jgi:hypothetical protein
VNGKPYYKSLLHLKNIIFLLLSFVFISCSQNDNQTPTETNTNEIKVNVTPVILVYGMLQPYLYEQAQTIICKQYNLQFLSVGGCIVSKSLIDSVAKENKKTELLLKHYTSLPSIDSAYRLIELEYKRIQKAEQFLQSSDSVRQEIPFIKEAMLYFTQTSNKYEIKIIQLKSTFSGALQDTTHIVEMDTTGMQLFSIKKLKS